MLALSALLASNGCSDSRSRSDGDARTSDGSAADSDGSGSDAGACTVPSYADDIVLDTARAVSLPSVAAGAASGATHAFVCGQGYLAAVTPGAPPIVLQDALLSTPCAVAAGGQRVLVATRAGALLALRFDGAALSVIGSNPSAATTLYDVAINGDDVWLAAGSDGVLSLSLAGDALSTPVSLAGAHDARGVVRTGTGDLLVADGAAPGEQSAGGGAQIRLLSTGAGGGSKAELVELPGIATRALVQGDRAVVLRPGYGFDVLDLAAGALTLRYSTPMAIGLPFDALLEGDTLLVAAGSALVRYALGQSAATRVSLQGRADSGALDSRWYRAVARAGSGPSASRVALAGETLIPFSLGAGDVAPDIALEQATVTLVGGQREALFRILNIGSAPLVVTGVSADAPFSVEVDNQVSPPRPGCATQTVVAPGSAIVAWHRTSDTSEQVVAPLRLVSNDPDEPTLTVQGEANRPTIKVGDSVEDFALLSVDGRRFVSSDRRGKALLLKLYNKT
ncbi:MAG: hypothetical protein KC503_01090 [Myxococcales bacterium]|nr:hypothetical protein [Myxococcales bacterium]